MATSENSIVDLDRSETWPHEVLEQIGPNLVEIAAEYAAQLEYDLSAEKWFTPSPQAPRTDAAKEVIEKAMEHRRIRVFHATRLLEGNSILSEGLHPLDLARQIDCVRGELACRGFTNEVAALDAISLETDLNDQSYACRQNQVWFTPLRRYLHDGGCDVFFDHWGGEAIQRITQYDERLKSAICSLGNPSVVVANIPAFGACLFSGRRLPLTMLSLMLETAGLRDSGIEGWDVLLKQAVPPDWIEAVVLRTDPSIAV